MVRNILESIGFSLELSLNLFKPLFNKTSLSRLSLAKTQFKPGLCMLFKKLVLVKSGLTLNRFIFRVFVALSLHTTLTAVCRAVV